MKRLPTVAVLMLIMPSYVNAGELGTLLPWITDATAHADLELNNDDYVGAVEDNPNRFNLNKEGPCCPGADVRQSIGATERIIPTVVSGGITEYVLILGGGYPDDDAPDIALDQVFQIQLGFGTGDNFVPAGEVPIASGLRFDAAELVSPEIEPYAFFAEPILDPIGHRDDTILFQGSSDTGGIVVENFSAPEMLRLPLDIPDLPASVRDFYSAEDLDGFPINDVPFTIRMGPVDSVPEPSSWTLAILVLICLGTTRQTAN